jgi:hypothetical protein
MRLYTFNALRSHLRQLDYLYNAATSLESLSSIEDSNSIDDIIYVSMRKMDDMVDKYDIRVT